jgi:hypothetical protein
MRNKLSRTNLYIREDQHEFMEKHSNEKGITASEIMRIALDLYIDKQEEKEKNNKKDT